GAGEPLAPAGDGEPRHEERRGREKGQRAGAAERPAHPGYWQGERDPVAAPEQKAQREERDEPARRAEHPVGQDNPVAGGQEEDRARERGQNADAERASPVV